MIHHIMYSNSSIKVLAASILISACSPTNAGNRIDYDDLSKLKLGITKSDAIELLGSPTFVSEPDKETFFYAQQHGKKVLFILNIPKDQEIISIHFSDNNTVDAIKKYTLSDMRSVKMEDYDKYMVLFKPR